MELGILCNPNHTIIFRLQLPKLVNMYSKCQNSADTNLPNENGTVLHFTPTLEVNKMCIRVDANGFGGAAGTHVSVYACLMKGKNDDNLPWPFTGEIIITLLNQLADRNHCTDKASFSQDSETSRRVVTSERASRGYELRKFLPHNRLAHDAAKNCHYLKDDCLFFQMKTKVTKPVKPWLTSTV